MIALWIIVSVLFVLATLTIVVLFRLNLYIAKLEEQFKEQVELTGNLKQSLKDIIAEGFLLDDGRLKKLNIQKERNMIYNGVKNEEETYEF